MKITGTIRCLFEQSGTFRDVFRELGYAAYDYDIADKFNKTDYRIDIFREIDEAFMGLPNMWDKFVPEDLIMIFFPCTYFSPQSQAQFWWNSTSYKGMSPVERATAICSRSKKREQYYQTFVRLYSLIVERNLRAIIENPWGKATSFLCNNGIVSPTFVDWNRRKRGDYYIKPTAYWYINCEPTHGFTHFYPSQLRKVESTRFGIERSLLSPDYARAFINDYILADDSADGDSLTIPGLNL